MTAPRFGVHLAVQKGLAAALEEARRLGCRTAQIFSKNPRAWAAAAVDHTKLEAFRALRAELGITPLAVHASYLINLASPDPELRARSAGALAEELDRAGLYGAEHLVVHVGSSSSEPDRGRALGRVAEAVRGSLGRSRAAKTTLLLENMAGERGDVGCALAELKELLDLVRAPERVGVCLDTCHAFQAGYDLRDREGVERLVREVRGTFGFEALKLVHCNDSKKPLGGRTDRHEHIGRGFIGEAGFRELLRHPDFRGVPFVLETPKDSPSADQDNLELLRRLADGRLGT